MAGRKPTSAGTRASQRTLLSRALALLIAIAFTFATFLTQTHVHGTPSGASTAAADIFDGPAPAKDKAPQKNDPANCPICQQAASAGHFVMPATAAILLPSLSVSVIQTAVLAIPFARAITHSWQGRAPPSA